MSKPKVFVIGASGNCGKSTLIALSKNFADKLDIVAGVRKPENVVEYKSLRGVTVVRAEMGKREELIEVLTGVQVLFIVVPARLESRAELIRVTGEAAKKAGVKHITSVSTAITVGPDKIIGKHFYDIENTLSNLGPGYTFLRLPYFMENLGYFKQSIEKSSTMCDAADPSKRFPIICMDDVGLVAAVVMSDPGKHNGKTYDMVSDRRSYNDIVKAFKEVLGKEIKYVQRSMEENRAVLLQLGLPEWNADGGNEFIQEINEGKHEQGNDGDIAAVTGKAPTSVEAWLEAHADLFK